MSVPPPAGRRERDGRSYASVTQKRPKFRLFALCIVAILCVGVNRTSPYSIQDHESVSPSVALSRAKLARLSSYMTLRRSSSHDMFAITRARATSYRSDRYEFCLRPFVANCAVHCRSRVDRYYPVDRWAPVDVVCDHYLCYKTFRPHLHRRQVTSSSLFCTRHHDRTSPGRPD
uniref:Uncharacterized protein n=1 Tax=Peronospora matthiolae TaxID=2874970 RepID=A0AAV1VLP4_9STRA